MATTASMDKKRQQILEREREYQFRHISTGIIITTSICIIIIIIITALLSLKFNFYLPEMIGSTLPVPDDEHDDSNVSFVHPPPPSHRKRQDQEDTDTDDGAAEATITPIAERTRRFNLLSLLPLTTNPKTDINGQRTPIPFRIEIEMSAWLAWYHYTTNNNTNITSTNHTQLLHHHNVLPHVQERLSQCDIDFHYSMRDSKFSALNAAKEFFDAYNDDAPTSSQQQQQRPNAVIGSARSVVSSVMSYMASAFEIPQISSGSTAAYLNNKDTYSTFARTIATNAGDANAMALYLYHWNVTHVGIIFINDGYGNDFHSDLVNQLTSFNISVFSEPYDDFTIEQSINQLSKSEMRYIIAILNPSNWKSVIRLAMEYQIVGRPDYFWIFESLQFASASFQLDRESEADLARAIHGSAVITVTEQEFAPFDSALANASQDQDILSLYISQHAEPEIFSNYSFPLPSRTIYQYFTYDAAIAMMIAACETPRDDVDEFSSPSGTRIYEQLLHTEFVGVSGYVAFHPNTGTRKSDGLVYGVRNIQFPDNLVTGTSINVLSTLTDVITLTTASSVTSSSLYIKALAPLYFASNTTVPPLPLPPVDVDMNLVPTSLLAFCLTLCGLVMILAVWWIYWTFKNREKDIVKASQPIFLFQICVGTFLISSAVIPMSMQEPVSQQGLDISCMATLWLYSVGFVTAFSALFTKTWRLNKLFGSSQKLRRVVVRPRDVALPFIALMVLNIVVLLAWTLHSPLVWERQVVDSYDKFGRSVESVGMCASTNTMYTSIYLSMLAAINISVLIFANYQAYMARNLPSEFSESTYIAIAMGSFLEVAALGIPLLFVSTSDSSIRYLIRSVLTIATSLSPLLPIFLPKYLQRSVNRRYHDVVVATTGAAPVRSRVTISIGSTSKPLSNGLSFDINSECASHDDDAFAPGTTKIRRNDAFLKEQEVSSILKSSGTGSRPFLRNNRSNEFRSARETTESSGRETVSSISPAD